jgi:uncharacterized RDD family membrane protein YckC
MTRDQHLAFCKVCTNRAFDAQLGIICKLTGRHADFENTCPSFNLESKAVAPSDNPYEYRASQNVDLIKVSGGIRFANYLIDLVVLYLLLIFSSIMVAILMGLFAPEEFQAIDEESSSFTLGSYVIWFALRIAYYTFMESVFGRTIGKLITGTKVVTRDGRTPATQKIFLRTLSRLVPFEPFTFLGDEARGWHDQWTDTWVVKVIK